MKKKFLLSENGQRTVSALCILAAYIIVYGSFALFEYVLTKKALVAFVYIAAGTFFTYRPCRNKFAYSLAKSLPRPLDIAVSVFIAAAAGVFAAPYYMGERLIPFEYTKEALTAMPLKKLKKLDLDLTLIGLQFMPERKKIPLWIHAYGCKTYGEATELHQLVTEIYCDRFNEKYD